MIFVSLALYPPTLMRRFLQYFEGEYFLSTIFWWLRDKNAFKNDFGHFGNISWSFNPNFQNISKIILGLGGGVHFYFGWKIYIKYFDIARRSKRLRISFWRKLSHFGHFVNILDHFNYPNFKNIFEILWGVGGMIFFWEG